MVDVAGSSGAGDNSGGEVTIAKNTNSTDNIANITSLQTNTATSSTTPHTASAAAQAQMAARMQAVRQQLGLPVTTTLSTITTTIHAAVDTDNTIYSTTVAVDNATTTTNADCTGRATTQGFRVIYDSIVHNPSITGAVNTTTTANVTTSSVAVAATVANRN